jgi:hypothetical protein
LSDIKRITIARATPMCSEGASNIFYNRSIILYVLRWLEDESRKFNCFLYR